MRLSRIPMIDLLLKCAADPAAQPDLLRAIDAHAAASFASMRRGERHEVAAAEEAMQADPGGAFAFDATGAATLSAAGHTWHAGRFETVSVGALRTRVAARRAAAGAPGDRARVRLWVLDGVSAATDIGSLQATAGDGALFQVASQFNCLESPGPFVTPVANYFADSTQGPRAAISAFPATLLRHYAAPGEGGERFVQATNARQINLLARALDPAVATVKNGYLEATAVADPKALAAALEAGFEAIEVGVQDDVQVVLGYDWDGGVEDSEHRRIAQVFTSTLAGGDLERFEGVYRPLLRAAYLGTLLAAASLGQTRVVLTLIGGGVFANPISLIWQAIQWAVGEVEPLLARDLDVVVNSRNMLDREATLAAVRARGGALLTFAPKGGATILR